MKEELFLYIQTLLPATIKTFDWWNNQITTQDEEDLFDCPAIFVEVFPFAINSLGRKRLTAKIDFVLHIVTQPTQRTRRGHKQQPTALNSISSTTVLNAVNGKTNNSNVGRIQATFELPDHNFSSHIDNRLQFRVRVNTDAAIPATIPATGNGKVTEIT